MGPQHVQGRDIHNWDKANHSYAATFEGKKSLREHLDEIGKGTKQAETKAALTADHLKAGDEIETAKGNKGTVFWKPGHGKFVRYKVEGGGGKYLDASIGSIVKVNGKSAAEHVAGLGGKPPASTGRGEKPKVALKAGAVPHRRRRGEEEGGQGAGGPVLGLRRRQGGQGHGRAQGAVLGGLTLRPSATATRFRPKRACPGHPPWGAGNNPVPGETSET